MILTLLPYPSFAESAGSLHPRHLNAQRADVLSIATVLIRSDVTEGTGPSILMWEGYGLALTAYGIAVCDEWRARGHKDTMKDQLLDLVGERLGMTPGAVEGIADQALLERETEWNSLHKLPPWLGNEDVHNSHRAYLLRSNVPKWYRQWGWEDLDIKRGLVWPSVGPDDEVVLSYSSEPVAGTGPQDKKGRRDMPTRTDVVSALREKGYDGPVSYSKPRLEEMLATVESGGTIDAPRRGRPKGNGDDPKEGDLPPSGA